MMHGLVNAIKTTILGGFVVLLPIARLVFVMQEMIAPPHFGLWRRPGVSRLGTAAGSSAFAPAVVDVGDEI